MGVSRRRRRSRAVARRTSPLLPREVRPTTRPSTRLVLLMLDTSCRPCRASGSCWSVSWWPGWVGRRRASAPPPPPTRPSSAFVRPAPQTLIGPSFGEPGPHLGPPPPWRSSNTWPCCRCRTCCTVACWTMRRQPHVGPPRASGPRSSGRRWRRDAHGVSLLAPVERLKQCWVRNGRRTTRHRRHLRRPRPASVSATRPRGPPRLRLSVDEPSRAAAAAS